MSPRQTPLYPGHLEQGGRMVDFAGWSLPIHYGSQMAEHHAVRGGCGVFDVSHMTISDLAGEGCAPLLRRLLANDVARLEAPGRALYSCMLNHQGGVIDDLIVYRRPDGFRVVSNAATRERVVGWVTAAIGDQPIRWHQRDDLAMIAVQGPAALASLTAALPPPVAAVVAGLRRFTAVEVGAWMVARTGYTGEDGFELMLPATPALALWRGLIAAGAVPCGLGARDTLRLEAGLALYGHEMDESTPPSAAGLAWSVDLRDRDRDFIGRSAIDAVASGGRQVGVILRGRGVLRDGIALQCGDEPIGHLTSGSYSPTLGASIGLARIGREPHGRCQALIRDRAVAVELVKPPFVRNGEVLHRTSDQPAG